MADSPKPISDTVGQMPLTIQEAMSGYFQNNACLGEGDLRVPVTLEALQRNESQDVWTIGNRKLGRANVMELSLDMVSSGYSITSLFGITGFPKPRTFMQWMTDYKPFADLMEQAEKMRAIILAEQALDIVDSSDAKTAFKNKIRADVRMRLAEAFNPKKYGKKQQIDVTHNLDNLSSEETWSRFRSILVAHKDMIAERTGIKVEIPCEDAEIVETVVEETPEVDPMTLGMQGTPVPVEDEWTENLHL